jgi:uncharacterized protein YeaO (DUF488 family)
LFYFVARVTEPPTAQNWVDAIVMVARRRSASESAEPDLRRGPFRVTRIYEEPGQTRAYRVLVDRLWPRGISKQRAGLDEWLKDAAPSTPLRQWYSHDPAKFEEFARRYRAELRRSPGSPAVRHLLELGRSYAEVTLLTATRDLDRSGARVLLDHLARRHLR